MENYTLPISRLRVQSGLSLSALGVFTLLLKLILYAVFPFLCTCPKDADLARILLRPLPTYLSRLFSALWAEVEVQAQILL